MQFTCFPKFLFRVGITLWSCPHLGQPNNPFPSVLLSTFSLSFSSLPYIFLSTFFSTVHFLLRSRNQFSHSYCHDSCMSFIRHIYCTIPFRYHSLCPSIRAQSFGNWHISLFQECVLRPAVPNSQKKWFLFSTSHLKKEKQQVFEILCFGKKKQVHWTMNKIRLLYGVFSFWPFKDLHLHTRTYMRKKFPWNSFYT
jgi:hypothetical protein